jgi:hypothetical protein
VDENNVRDFGGVRVDTTDWPIVMLDFPARHERDSLVAMLTHLEQLLRYGRKTGDRSFVITDLSRIRQIPGADQRRYSADWMQRNIELHKTATVGAANVAPSAILRGMVTAVFWLRPPPTPTAVVASREEAIQRGLEALHAAGIRLPARLRDSFNRRTG